MHSCDNQVQQVKSKLRKRYLINKQLRIHDTTSSAAIRHETQITPDCSATTHTSHKDTNPTASKHFQLVHWRARNQPLTSPAIPFPQVDIREYLTSRHKQQQQAPTNIPNMPIPHCPRARQSQLQLLLPDYQDQ